MHLDALDIKILDLIQKKGRIKRNEIAEKIDLSLPATSERLRKLEENGFLEGVFGKVNHTLLGKDVTAIVLVTVDSSRHFASFVDHALHTDDILECHAITGDGTHFLKVRTENTASLEKLLGKIQSWQGVTKTATTIVLSTQKETFRIKIPLPS